MAETAKKMTNSNSAAEKIDEAMKLVNEARAESMSDAKATIEKQIEQSWNRVEGLRESMLEQWEKNRDQVQESVNSRPFAYIAGATVIGVLIGFILGRKR